MLDGFVDEVIEEIWDRGQVASAEQQAAAAALEDAEADLANVDDEDTEEGQRLIDAVNAAHDNLRAADRNLAEVALELDVAEGRLGGVRERLIRREESFRLESFTPREREAIEQALRREEEFQRSTPGVSVADLDRPENEGGRPDFIRDLLQDVFPQPGEAQHAIENIHGALERQRLIENDDHWNAIAPKNQLDRNDIKDGDDLVRFEDDEGNIFNPELGLNPDGTPKGNLGNVAKNFDEECSKACRPICFEVINEDFVNANPMLNPAIDVLMWVNDPAMNPQNADKPDKFFTKDLEPEDKGIGWKMCECCPCPPTGELIEIPTIIIPPITTPPIIVPAVKKPPTTTTTTTPKIRRRRTTTTSTSTTSTTLTTPPPGTTICPPGSRGEGPRCNVLGF